ncbi:COG4705 family protein [Pseudonocardia xinjiangensis]|uniref:COG4705 family protein n=1 Tax=Pseudonocardia xinjiangensis TaxID=75289 RepID=UPI003D8D85FF
MRVFAIHRGINLDGRTMSSTMPGPGRGSVPDHLAYSVMRKLPHVTLLFWIVKIIAVTLGETAGDLFGITLGVGYVVTALIFLAFFVVVLVLQIRAKRFHPALFWAVVLGTSLVGTEVSDFLDRGPGDSSVPSGVGYGWGALILTTLLAIIFVVWWRTGQTYDVENIASRRGEILYWIAILVSNTLGTATGDWLSDDTGLGFHNAFFIIAAIMLVIVGAHYLTNINTMLLFWLAFVLTRPLGAAGGDSLTKPVDEGGLGWGTLWASLALFALLVALVAYQAIQVHRHPLEPLPYPTNGRTGAPQQPNGAVITPTTRPGSVTGAGEAGAAHSGAGQISRPRPAEQGG